MKPLTLTAIATLTGGQLVAGDPERAAVAVSTDSRTAAGGSLFVALVGERFDAHEFVGQVASAGAAGAVVSRVPDGFQEQLPRGFGLVRVGDTLAALQRLASGYRDMLGATAIGITGSSGKTSTKDMIYSVLRGAMPVRATTGNLNNHIGLPLTILSMEASDRAGIWEMGMNHAGEIAALAAIARPDIAVITNIGTAHIEFLGSREAIADEKGSLVAALGPDGCAVLPASDPFTPRIAARSRGSILTAGIGTGDVQARDLAGTPQGSRFVLHLPDGQSAAVELPVPGRHMVANATLAAAVGTRLGLDASTIAAGLSDLVLTAGRLQIKVIAGVRFLDDTYNANPDSMRAALATLREVPTDGRRVAVLGRMAELGSHSDSEHAAIGAAASEGALAADLVASVGDGAEAYGLAHHFRDSAGAATFLKNSVSAGDVILVKGSRSARTERVLEEFAKL